MTPTPNQRKDDGDIAEIKEALLGTLERPGGLLGEMREMRQDLGDIRERMGDLDQKIESGVRAYAGKLIARGAIALVGLVTMGMATAWASGVAARIAQIWNSGAGK